ncbi:hypothetical protein FACS189496_1700 [Bacilli bacterium]|nr:hypothetical protein FACS189496_1700 [Bacilli bacterium]
MKSNNFITLKSKKDFDNLIKNSKTISNDVYLIKFVFTSLDKSRYAIAASKKHFKTAVLRNKIKRQIRTYVSQLNYVKIFDMLIIIKSNYKTSEYALNADKFNNLYNKIK